MASVSLTCCLLIICLGAMNAYDVAFSAKKARCQSATKRVAYDLVSLNRGHGYNGHTGVFRAPYTGLYTFSYNFMTYPKRGVHMYLYKNNVIVSRSYAYNKYGYANGGNTINMFLHRGNRVWTKNYGYVYGGCYTTFNGFMISSYWDKSSEQMDETPELDAESLNEQEN